MTLSDTQSVTLSKASQHPDLLAPLPAIPAAARNAVLRSMIKNGFLEEVLATLEARDLAWRQDDDGQWLALRATPTGLAAIGIIPDSSDAQTEPRELTEQELEHELDLQQEALDAEQDAETALADLESTTAAVAVPRTGLRAAAAVVMEAWEAKADLTGPMAALKAAFTPAKAGRSAGNPRKPREGTKQDAVLALLRRKEGATIAQVIEVTGWAQHTVRGFFAGLKKKGHAVDVLERVKQVGPGKEGARGSYTIYHIAT